MNLIEYYPERHHAGLVGAAQTALQPLMDALEDTEEDFVQQLWPATATWGLDLWEAALGITKQAADTTAYRRTRVIAKLRGAGVTTVAMIQSVAESFSNGEVEIIQDAANYSFTVKFVGTIGIPPNMDDLTAAIEEIKPAHLAYSYEYLFRTWDMIGAYTWEQLSAYTWDQVREGTL